MAERELFRLPERAALQDLALALDRDAGTARMDAEALDRLPQGSGAYRRDKARRDQAAANIASLLAGLDERTLDALRFGLDPRGARR